MEGPIPRLGHPHRVKALVGLTAVLGVVAAGCSSAPASNRSATTTTVAKHHGYRASTTTTSTTTTTAPPATTTTAPPVQSSSVQIVVHGSGADITFASSDISGSLSPQGGAFSQGGTLYTFTVAGVQYTGSPATSSGSGGLVGSVSVAQGSRGATVTVKLTSPAAHATFGLGHNEIGVSFS